MLIFDKNRPALTACKMREKGSGTFFIASYKRFIATNDFNHAFQRFCSIKCRITASRVITMHCLEHVSFYILVFWIRD